MRPVLALVLVLLFFAMGEPGTNQRVLRHTAHWMMRMKMILVVERQRRIQARRLVLFAMGVWVPPPLLGVTLLLQLLLWHGWIHHHSSGRIVLGQGPGQVCRVFFGRQLVEDSQQGLFVVGRDTWLLQPIQHKVADKARSKACT